MDAKIIAGILAAGGAALAVGGIYSMNKKTGYFKKEIPSDTMFPVFRLRRQVR